MVGAVGLAGLLGKLRDLLSLSTLPVAGATLRSLVLRSNQVCGENTILEFGILGFETKILTYCIGGTGGCSFHIG